MGTKKNRKYCGSNLYSIVERLREQTKDSSRNKQFFNFTDPVALRALRIHRHLRALEEEILDSTARRTITLSLDHRTGRIVLNIRNDEIHCSRVAYLTQEEFAFLRRNRDIARKLRKCGALLNVA